VVEDEEDDEGHDGHDADEDGHPAPAVLGELLAIQGARREGHEAHDDVADGDAATRRGHELCDGGDGREELHSLYQKVSMFYNGQGTRVRAVQSQCRKCTAQRGPQ
jgi:hypothetical protein